MIAYIYRLLCLSLASFFVIHFFSGVIVKLLQNATIRLAQRMSARSAARFLLAARLLPVTFAVAIVAGLCVPSYLSLEPRGIVERVGPLCALAALMTATLWGLSIYRGLRALLYSLPELPSPVLALVGIFHPKLVISREALAVLSPEELQSAIRHEQAHQLSRDNLKRLSILFAPDLFPFWNGFSRLDQAWAKFAEWAADDHAAGEDVERAISLAAALVRVARLTPPSKPIPLMTAFLADASDLSARVERLLSTERWPAHRRNIAVPAIMLLFIGLLLSLAAQTAILNSVHQLLERLIH